jgi:hypothetical protein
MALQKGKKASCDNTPVRWILSKLISRMTGLPVKTYFPDTNFFFECRKAIDLPWHELDVPASGAGDDILLIVPPTVITEIERHKAKGNSRTAKRARDISAKLREALLATDRQTLLRESNPRVVLQLPPVFKVDFSQYPDLDRERPDHRIAAECATMTLSDANLLTDDTLLALAARSISLSTVLIPMDWRLPPENDERDDALAKLQSELRGYKQAAPEIELNILDASGRAVTEFSWDIVRYVPSSRDMDAAVSMVKARHPMKTDFNESPPAGDPLIQMMGMWRSIKPEAIREYQEKEYPEWVKEVREKLAELVSIYNGMAREIAFTISIANSGFVNAENLTLQMRGFDGLLLLDGFDEDELQDRKKLLSLPAPPAPPSSVNPMWSGLGRHAFENFDRSLILPYDIPGPRQSNKLYFSSQWPGHIPVDQMELECAALPHQQDSTKRSFRAYVGEQLGSAPRLRVIVAASNLRRPIEAFIKLKTTVATGNFLSNLSETGTIMVDRRV